MGHIEVQWIARSKAYCYRPGDFLDRRADQRLNLHVDKLVVLVMSSRVEGNPHKENLRVSLYLHVD